MTVILEVAPKERLNNLDYSGTKFESNILRSVLNKTITDKSESGEYILYIINEESLPKVIDEIQWIRKEKNMEIREGKVVSREVNQFVKAHEYLNNIANDVHFYWDKVCIVAKVIQATSDSE